MTFKEELTQKANMYEKNIDITDDINYIKERMEDCYTDREFNIYLYVPHTNFAIGHAHTNYASFFVPKGVAPQHYRMLFIMELEKLGFNEYELNDTHDRYSDCYSIKVRW